MFTSLLQSPFDWGRFEAFPVIGILRGFDHETAVAMVTAAARGGLTTVEVTMNTPYACDQISKLVQLGRGIDGGLNVGAGTVLSEDQFDQAYAAGAQFVVTPGVLPLVISRARDRGLPTIIGAMTPTEALAAFNLGASIIKLFPSDFLGPKYFRSIAAPLDFVPLMPTGGVTVENIAEFREAGAVAYGLGTELFSRTQAQAGNWPWFTERMQQFRAALGPIAI